MHAQQNAGDANGGIEPLRNQMNGLQEFLKPTQRQVVRLHRHEHFVGNGKRIDAQDAQAWRTVEQYHIVISVDRLELGAQYGLHAFLLRKFTFNKRQFRNGRNEIQSRTRCLHCVFDATCWVKQQIANRALFRAAFNAKVQR